MYLLFTLIEILILIALAAIIVAAIAVLVIRLKKDGGGNNSPAAAGLNALAALEAKVAEVREKGSATNADCTEMRNLLATARSNGVPTLTTDGLQSKINKLCPTQ